MKTKPLIVIVGPTASGKSSLAIKLAKKHGGEIICADSRTVYVGMNIGTAKPSLEERDGIPHWGLDIVEPGCRYTVAEFKDYANQKILEIRKRGNVPFLVGGSGLYIDSVVFDYQFGDSVDNDFRHKLEALSVDELQVQCQNMGIQMPVNYKNKRHLIRAIELKGLNKKRSMEPLDNSYIFGIKTDPQILKKRIQARAVEMLSDGIMQEARTLGEKYGWENEAMTGNVYPLCRQFIQGELDVKEVEEKFIVQDWRLVKRQLTWFKRNSFITWLTLDQCEKRINSLLDSEH